MSNSAHLAGTVSLVTGASSGIGEATTEVLAARGSLVVAAARRGDRLAELVARIEAAGGRAEALPLDVTDAAAVTDAVDGIVERHGRLDIVINNAGVMLNAPAADALLEEWDRMVDLNIKGLLYVAKAALAHLEAAAASGPREVADLVNVSSIAGRVSRPGGSVYQLTKHGVGAFSESLRQELAEQHVRVSLVEPGVVATELASHLRPEAYANFLERFADLEPLEASDIAETIEFIVTRRRRVAINEVMIRPSGQQA